MVNIKHLLTIQVCAIWYLPELFDEVLNMKIKPLNKCHLVSWENFNLSNNQLTLNKIYFLNKRNRIELYESVG